jgi:hypothetical protein
MELQSINFQAPPERVRELESLMEEAGIKTKKELLNNALTLLEWAINEVRRGHVIASIDEADKRYKEITMPIFGSVKKHKTAAARL